MNRGELINNFDNQEITEIPQSFDLLLNPITTESIQTISKIFHSKPETVLMTPLYYVQIFNSIFECFDSLELLERICPVISNSNSAKAIVPQIPNLTNTLSSHSGHPSMLRAWGVLLVTFGSLLHKTNLLSPILSIAESCFNSSQIDVRIEGFQAWKRLILNFSFGDHLRQAKRIRLLMIPIANGLQFEKNRVCEFCLETYCFLLCLCSQKWDICPDFFTVLIEPCLNIKQENSIIMTMSTVMANLMSDKPSPSTDIPQSHHSDTFKMMNQSCSTLTQSISNLYPPEKWSMEEFQKLFQYFSHLPIIHDQDYNATMVRLWVSFLSKLQLDWNKSDENMVHGIHKVITYLQKHMNHPLIGHFISHFSEWKLPDRLFGPAATPSDFEQCQIVLRGIETILPITVQGTLVQKKLLEFQKQVKETIPVGFKIQKSPHVRTVKSSPLKPKLIPAVMGESKRLKKQKTEYFEIPLQTKSSPVNLTRHQLEKQESKTQLDLHTMYNTMVSPRTANTTSKSTLQTNCKAMVEHIDAIQSMTMQEVADMHKDIVTILTAISNRLST
jgi:hypothetical protein